MQPADPEPSLEPAVYDGPSLIRNFGARHFTGILVGAVFVVVLIVLLRRAYVADVSPFDEGLHLSYIQYAHGWAIPRTGDPMGSWGEQMYACRPTWPYGFLTTVPCGVDGPSSAYPDGGLNTAAGWPPLYYVATAQFMRPLLLLGVEPMFAARTVSAFFWALGSAALAYLVIRLCGSRVLGASAGVLGGTLPATWAQGSYVTPHSTAMLVGVALVVLLLWSARTDRPVWVVGLVSAGGAVLAQLTLPHSIAAISVISVASVALAWSRPTQRLRLVTLSLTLFVAGVVTYWTWTKLVLLRLVADGPVHPSTPPEGLRAALRDNWSLFWPRGLAEVQGLSLLETQWTTLITYGTIALVGFWILSDAASEQRSVALGVVIGAPVASVSFALLLDFAVPFRYGASIYALVLVLLAMPSASRTIRIAVGCVAAASALIALASANTFMIIV